MPEALSYATPSHRAIAAADIINSATPIENELLGLHPRLLCVRRSFAQLHRNLTREPWATQYRHLLCGADKMLETPLPADIYGTPYATFDVRQLGGHLITMALAYRLSGRAAYLERARFLMERLGAEPLWGDSLIYGHWAQGFALALDWLWHDLDREQRQRCCETLYKRTCHVFDHWSSYRAGEPFGYTWNISAVVLGGITAAAACLYGERPGVAPLANLAWEKLRCQSFALGPDGVSPEGVMYGGYYGSYLTVNFHLAEELLGLDMFATTPWLQRYARSLLAQALPRDSWLSDNFCFMQGDMHGDVFGLEGMLRAIASGARDGLAQWLADELIRAGHAGMGALSLLFFDESVDPAPPAAGRAPFDLMEDFGIVVMRSDRSGRENAAALKCGPNIGHHAAKLFRHPLGGGHMYPNNGDLQIFAHGEWILPPPGYVYKETSFHNTLLINGAGQLGDKSEWFEDLPYRRSRKYPHLERAEHHGHFDYVLANLTAAYPDTLLLVNLRRHLLYLRDGLWLLADALEAENAAEMCALFHTRHPLAADGPTSFRGNGANSSFAISAHAATPVTTHLETQTLRHSGGHVQGEWGLLRVTAAAARRQICVTAIQTWTPGAPRPASPVIQTVIADGLVRISGGNGDWHATIDAFGPHGVTMVQSRGNNAR